MASAVSALVLAGAVGAPAAAAQENPNPIDWTVVTWFESLDFDVPLRVGQDDVSPDEPGFGERHTVRTHGAVPDDDVLAEALEDEDNCVNVRVDRVNCRTEEVTVSFSTVVDPRSEDDEIVGIVTAFFNAPPPS